MVHPHVGVSFFMILRKPLAITESRQAFVDDATNTDEQKKKRPNGTHRKDESIFHFGQLPSPRRRPADLATVYPANRRPFGCLFNLCAKTGCSVPVESRRVGRGPHTPVLARVQFCLFICRAPDAMLLFIIFRRTFRRISLAYLQHYE